MSVLEDVYNIALAPGRKLKQSLGLPAWALFPDDKPKTTLARPGLTGLTDLNGLVTVGNRSSSNASCLTVNDVGFDPWGSPGLPIGENVWYESSSETDYLFAPGGNSARTTDAILRNIVQAAKYGARCTFPYYLTLADTAENVTGEGQLFASQAWEIEACWILIQSYPENLTTYAMGDSISALFGRMCWVDLYSHFLGYEVIRYPSNTYVSPASGTQYHDVRGVAYSLPVGVTANILLLRRAYEIQAREPLAYD